MKDNKKVIISIFCVLTVLLIAFGVTYAVFTYTKQGETENTITSGKLTFLYTENTGTGTGINITEAFPVSDEVGKAYSSDNQVFDFKVESEIVGEAQIPYEVTIKKLASSTLEEMYVKIYLTDTTEGEEISLLEPTKYNELPISSTHSNEKQIYFDTVEANENYEKDFRLRMWIAEGSDQEAINDKSFTVKVGVYSPAEIGSKSGICKRATTLHTETCNQTPGSYFCATFGSNTGDTITYGNLGTQGTLTSGDAFDCDVNGDGVYDSITERFYYVTDVDSNTAVLIYYNNTTAGLPDNKTVYAFNSAHSQNPGPGLTLVEQLPTTDQWPNVKLKNTTRNITDELGNIKVENYSYEGHAARLLTVNELFKGCGLEGTTVRTAGELLACNYILENTKYTSANSSYGTWLESYNSATMKAYFASGSTLKIATSYVSENASCGARPAIEVAKASIEY